METSGAPAASTSAHRILVGTLRIFLAESLIIPSGLLTAAYLARRLGPEGYGVFAVAAALVAWIEWSLSALLARASVKVVADAVDWRPAGSTILSVQLVIAVGAALLLCLVAPGVGILLGVPSLPALLRLFALDIPLFSMAQAHRSILMGLGSFTQRAYIAAARWVSRLAIVVLLVELGLSIQGAILGSIAASAIELAVARTFVRPAFSHRAVLRGRELLVYAAPLLITALSLRMFDKLDLITLTAMGGSVQVAGFYGAAQNLSILPGLFAMSFSPILLSTLSRAFSHGEVRRARATAREALRGLFLLVPFGVLVAGSSSEIVGLVFGQKFDPAAPLFSWLILGAIALVFVSVVIAMLTAAGYPILTTVITAPVLLFALIGYLVAIPVGGALAAAMVTSICAILAAGAGLVAVHRVCQTMPPPASVIRAILISAAVYVAAVLWPTAGWLILLKFLSLGSFILLAFGMLGEFSAAEVRALRSIVRRQVVAA
jgi:O-antigen/teichoic acid export membrane protein